MDFQGGVTIQYNFTKTFSLRTNISYERKGSKSKGQITGPADRVFEGVTLRSNFDYLTIPLLARFTFGEKIQFHLNAGPYAGYLVKQVDILDAFGAFPESETDNTDAFKRRDFGLTTGLGVSYPIHNKLLLSMEIRNNLGLANMSNFEFENDDSIKTVSTSLLVGIAYRLGSKN